MLLILEYNMKLMGMNAYSYDTGKRKENHERNLKENAFTKTQKFMAFSVNSEF